MTLLMVLMMTVTLQSREQVHVSFSNLKINDFIKLVGRITDRNILMTHDVKGSVNLITSAPVYDDEVMDILISVLESKGFTLVEKGSVYEVVRSADAAKHGLPVIGSGKKASGSVMQTQAISVKGENVDVVAAKIRYLISSTGKLMTMKETNTLLISDYPSNIETIKQVITQLNRKQAMIMKIVPVNYAKIKELHTQIIEIAQSLFNPKVDTEQIKVLLNSDINGFILVGRQANVERLEATVKALDQEQNLNEVVQIFSLKNSDAKSVLTTLNEILAKQTFTDPTMKPNISMNEEINAVIVIGNPISVKGIKLIIDELDREKYQVYVQARIIEINKDDSEQLGIKYGLDGGIANSSGLYTLAADFGGSSIAPMNPLITTKLAGSLGNLESALALGATLDFLQENGVSQTVSNPSILCVNNQESSIYVGKTLSFQTGEATNSAGGTTNSFKREDVGLTLKIKPRVSSAEKVTLDVETILENILPTVDTNGQPATSKQTVTTQAILSHGENIIIGGLVKTYDHEIENKVPLLGDIPLLGALFRHKDITEQQDNLLVILTPYVIDKSEKLSALQEQLGEFGRIQRMYNERVFPVVKARAAGEDERPNDPFADMNLDQTP
jgi:general secretion pathway protein D